MKKVILGALAVVVLLSVGGYWWLGHEQLAQERDPITIGILTDLSGPAAYWGESTRAGAALAAEDLENKGYRVKFIYEDYSLDSAKAASAARKLTELDAVDAIYAEFNPGAIVASTIVKEKNIPMIYDAAVVSPLKESPHFFKTYLDYEAGCATIAQKFKDEGVTIMGVLQVNLEFGELCLACVKKVYGDQLVFHTYNLGDTDFRTALLKIKSGGAEAVINVGFEGDTYNTLRVIRDQGYMMRYGTVDDSISEQVQSDFAEELKGAWTFGLQDPPKTFKRRIDAISGNRISNYYGASEGYNHITQLVLALSDCKHDIACVDTHIASSGPDENTGFQKYIDRIAQLDMLIQRY